MPNSSVGGIGMGKFKEPTASRNQLVLMPQCLDEMVSQQEPVRLLSEVGLVLLGHAAIDGSKVESAAGSHSLWGRGG